MRLCPRCRVPMNEERRTFATLDHCPQCDGVFVEPGEGQSELGHRHDLTDLTRDGLATFVATSKIGCPSQHGPMMTYRLADDAPEPGHEPREQRAVTFEVDLCATCGGVFFDAGEADLLKELGRRAGTVTTATGARFASVPPAENTERAIEEVRASGGSAFSAFFADMVVGAVGAVGRLGRRHHRHRGPRF